MTEVAGKRRVLKWVLPRRGEAAFIGPGPVVAGEVQNGHAVVFTVEDDILEPFDVSLEDIANGTSDAGRWVRTYRTGIPLPAGATHLISVGDGDQIRHVFQVTQPRGQEQP